MVPYIESRQRGSNISGRCGSALYKTFKWCVRRQPLLHWSKVCRVTRRRNQTHTSSQEKTLIWLLSISVQRGNRVSCINLYQLSSFLKPTHWVSFQNVRWVLREFSSLIGFGWARKRTKMVERRRKRRKRSSSYIKDHSRYFPQTRH